MSQPIAYLLDSDLAAGVEVTGPHRAIQHAGRRGWHATSVHTRLRIPSHNLASPRGTLSLWILPLEAMHPANHMRHFDKFEPDFFVHGILSDIPDLRNRGDARFHLRYTSDWWRNLVAQFCRWSLTTPKQKAIIAPDHCHLPARVWHQITTTWDRAAGQFRLYLNGVRVATQTQFLPVVDELPGESLYAGNPMFALSQIEFRDQLLDDAQVASLYRAQATSPDEAVDRALRRMHAGAELSRFDWTPDATWKAELDLSLADPAHAEHFYVQGQPDAHAFTPEGMHVKTAPEPPGFMGAWTENKVESYYWTKRPFEGDVSLEVEFNLHRRNGLALVMIQSSGMQREDFMADHPLRTNGAMSMVCWENVRNYHWEFYREIDNTRNDVASHLFVKNPWMAGLAYRCMPELMELNAWHKLQLVQEGPRLRGAIDGVLIFDVTDRDDALTGPIFTFGRVALRAKYKTDMTFRNLVVRTRGGWDAQLA
jgi:transposase